MSTKGIDVSKWQGKIDFNKVKKAGYDFVIINAGYGRYSIQKDSYFETNYANAKAAGLGVGAYWYSYAATATDAQKEAETFYNIIKGKQFDYPIAYDLEDPSQNYLSKKVLNDMCDSFIGYLEKRGYYVCLYSFTNFIQAHIYKTTLNKYDLWLADWSTKSLDCGMWQHSSRGKVSGISGDVDLNIAYKNYPEIMKSKGLNGYPKPVEPKKTEKKGDVNGDGKVNSTDATLIAAHVKGAKKLPDDKIKMADVNGDGKVDTKDVTAVSDIAKGGKSETKKEEAPKTPQYISYTIGYGDTLIGIAKRYGASVIEIAEINRIKDVNKIYAGQVIKIPKK